MAANLNLILRSESIATCCRSGYNIREAAAPGRRFNLAEQKHVCCNSNYQIDRRHAEGPREGLPRRHQIPGDDWRRDSRELVGKIHNPAHLSDIVAAGNERGNRPANRRRRGKAADGYADPDQSLLCAVCVGRAHNSESTGRAADEDGFAYQAWVPTAPNQPIHQPASHQNVREGCENPWHAGVKKRMEQIDVQSEGKVTWQPGKQKVKDIVIRTHADSQSNHLALCQKIAERIRFHEHVPARAGNFNFFCNVLLLQMAQRRVIVRIAIYFPEEQKVDEADYAGEGKTPTPADLEQNNTDERNANGRSEFRGRVEDGCGEARSEERR